MSFTETVDQVKKWCLGVNSRAEAEEGIRRDTALQEGLKTWSKRLGKLALVLLGVVVLFRSGPMLIPAAIAGAAYGAVKLASHLVDRDIKNKREAEQQMAADEQAPQAAPKPSRQPAPKAAAKATGAFNATASEPANDSAPAQPVRATTAILKRFGFGR